MDDIIIAENWTSRFNKFSQFLQSRVEVTNEGTLRWYLSVRWRYNIDGSRIMATQTAYLEKVARVFNRNPDASKSPKTPMDNRFDVNRDDLPDAEDVNPEDHTLMKRLLGSLLFPAGWCRPECCYSVILFALYATNPNNNIIEAGVRALDYMIVKKHDSIMYSRNVEDLEGY